MAILETLPMYLAVGAASGVLAGMFGIGGGLVVIPVLVVVFAQQGISPDLGMHLALGTSLATIAVTGASSTWGHVRRGSVHLPYLKQMLPGLLIGTLLGSLAASQLPSAVLRRLFGVFQLLLAARIAFASSPVGGTRPARPLTMGLAGSVIGSASGLFGVGGGTLSVPWLLSRGATMAQAAGTASACGVFIALSGAATLIAAGWNNSQLPPGATGYVLRPAFFGIALASTPCAHLGVKLVHSLPATLVRRIFAAILASVGISFLF